MTAPAARPAAIDGASPGRVENVLLWLFMLGGIVGVLKGLVPAVGTGVEFYWLFSYEYGFIKRGLIGTLFSPLLKLASFERMKPLIVVAHVLVCLGIILVLGILFRRVIAREERSQVRFTVTLAFLCLMCSQLMPVLAHDTGYVDVYLIALVLGGLWLVLQQQYMGAAFVATIGPAVHEAFIFLWAPVAIVLLWSATTRTEHRAQKLLAAAVPLLAVAAVNLSHDRVALGLSMDAWPASPDIKSGHLTFTFGQSLRSAFEHMRQYEFQGHWDNFATGLAYFLVPSVLILWAAVFCYWPRWVHRRMTFLVAVAATLSPLAIVAIGWDLSRFMVWSNLAAAIALIGVSAPALTPFRANGE